MNQSQLIFFLCAFFSLQTLLAQEVILDAESNRFLINQKSNKPRLDVIVQNFSDYEKNVIRKSAVMDTITRPEFERVSDTEYTIRANRMGVKLTFVIRDYAQLNEGYYIIRNPSGALNDSIISRFDMQSVNYLNDQRAIALPAFPFLFRKGTVVLLDADKTIRFKLNVNFSYPKPELYYVDITDGYGNASWEDTAQIRKIVNRVNKVPTVYSHNNAVPDRVVINYSNLFFRFKKAYYDGKINETSLFCKIDDRFITKTPLEIYPVTDAITMAHEDDWYILPSGEHMVYAGYAGEKIPVYTFELYKNRFEVIIHYLKQGGYLILMLLYMYPWILVLPIGLILFSKWGNRLKKARDEAKKINLELQSIQSQLNPHFVFNALGSIQSLINQNKIESANSYLTDFSKLLRNSLNNNGKEMIPLSEELYVLDSYVKLERLRFNFQYQLTVDDLLQTTQVEIPSLLIQPVVENAIKHGISALGEEGILDISFSKNQRDLYVTIMDNGKGFDLSAKYSGKGLVLTRERIKLLNRQKYKITLDFNTDKGTKAIFVFKNFC